MPVAQPSERLLLIEQICKEKAYQFEYIDDFTYLLAKVSNGKNNSFFNFSQFPLNNANSTMLAKDKAYTYSLLNKAAIKIPKGDYFFITHQWRKARNKGKELSDALNYARQLGYPLFSKPLNGTFGHFAKLIHNEAELLAHFQQASEKYYAMIIQEPLFEKEHRIFIMDGKVRFAYCKAQAMIKGDGKSSISSLIDSFLMQTPTVNQYYKLNEKFIKDKLLERGLSKASILQRGQVFELSPNANPNSGGFVEDFRFNVSPACEQWANNIAKTINLRICGIDFFTQHSLDDNPQEFTVLEINGNPSLETLSKLGHQTVAKSILEEIVEKSLQG